MPITTGFSNQNNPFMHFTVLRAFLYPLLIAIITGAAWQRAHAQSDFYQSYVFTAADTLRGMLRPERTCYDVYYYDLQLKVDIDRHHLAGAVDIYYKVLEDFTVLQLDLYANMKIEKVVFGDQELKYRRQADAFFVTFARQQQKGDKGQLRVYYSGAPRVAKNPPWDGGFVWANDNNGDPWVGVACEGDGASLWWPNKDHLSDEPDSMAIRISVPTGLTCIANGNLRQIVPEGKMQRFDWFVSYPINNYNVTVNIAKYAHFRDVYKAKDGDTLALDYYVLPYNKDKAVKHFRQVHQVLACFEHYFDKYPYWRDGFALVETPYLGMEHQSAIAYGNQYMRGYLGGMIPSDMDWDYIIVHETGHEYFGNSVSCNDIAEMWIHESFTTYMEALFVEYAYSYADAIRYLNSQRYFISNKEPILGPPDVNFDNWDGSDHYYKGAWILHTLRHVIGNDDQWWALLKGFYRHASHSNITTRDFVAFVNQFTGKNFEPFFAQYLQYPTIPVFQYQLQQMGDDVRLRYRWKSDVPNFDMPLLVGAPSRYERILPVSDKWQEISLKNLTVKDFKVPTELFYIKKQEQKFGNKD